MSSETWIKCFIFGILLASCQDGSEETFTRFEQIDPREAGIDFINQLEYTEEVNVYTFRNFYNGAGVALGDLNNDGLTDIFFCGNQVDNRLYLNKGDFKFLDVTTSAMVSSSNVWSTGVSLIDINADGWLDIYVCKSGDNKGENRHNELFINRGTTTTESGLEVPEFVEESEKYGLDDLGLSTHATFLDYDLDGDLDCYLLNNSFRSIGNYDLRPGQRKIRDTEGGNKLYKNFSIERSTRDASDEPIFRDVSEEAGIYGSSIGFGLGVTFGDVNSDGWPDIYVSNDFFEKDYLYINQKNGRFEEKGDQLISEMSMGSMGADLADINNDSYPDIFVTEMLPHDEKRSKSKAQFENWNKYQSNIINGYHRQFARNVLQLNDRDGRFLEIGRFAGVEATDWSWGALICDLDNDGWKDLFVANGIYKDLLDQDYINFYSNPAEVRKVIMDEEGGISKLIDLIPSEPLANFVFENKAGQGFRLVSDKWGFQQPSFSNGSAYGDLDNDGDLELVINNVNMEPMIYKNNSVELNQGNFIQLTLMDPGSQNRNAIGAKITVFAGDEKQYLEINPIRGFMSSVDYRAHFGLGSRNRVDSIVIVWPDQQKSKISDFTVNQLIHINRDSIGQARQNEPERRSPLFAISEQFDPDYQHVENDYSDFDREPLLLLMHSNEGPACCSGDINNDGRLDFFVGGARGQPGILYIQENNGNFREQSVPALNEHSESEDVDCVFFDANGDGRTDLYVASGSSEFGQNNSNLMDRLYFNTGNFQFQLSDQVLPTFRFENSSSVDVIDFDSDSDQDLVISTFCQPYRYGLPGTIYVLSNDGNGRFENVSSQVITESDQLGMITDLSVVDIDNDNDQDLLITGEWMGIYLFQNNKGIFEKIETGLDSLYGLWNRMIATDLNEDGYQDLIVGNHGLNSRIRASSTNPWNMYINDFDQNGSVEQIFTYSTDEGEFPFAQRMDLLRQIPSLGKKYPEYGSYSGQTVQQIFGTDNLDRSLNSKLTELRSGVIWNLGNGEYNFVPLPMEAQLSPIYALGADDFDYDGIKDIIVGGNQFRAKPEFGIQSGNRGLVLKGGPDGSYSRFDNHGIEIDGEIREILLLGEDKKKIIFAVNNAPIIIYKSYEDE